ncbi:MAG TPA: hypothetical protein VGR64_02095 [Terracidiphilus sp.]|nr:hypothetical protein [Terracidiphilus sp.]
MVRSRFARFAVYISLAAFLCASAAKAQDNRYRGRKFKPPPATSSVTVTVVRKDDGKVIENASVIWHLVGDKGGMELHTNEEGKSMIDILPTGSKVVLQVLAHGYQTFGQEYTISKPAMTFKVALSRPVGQYTIYGHHDVSVEGPSPIAVGVPDTSKTAATKKDDGTGSAESKDKPADSASQDKPAAKPAAKSDSTNSASKDSASKDSANKDSNATPAPQI